MNKTVADHESVIATRQNGEAVAVSLEEFRSWEETAYLLSSPSNARKLVKSLDEASRGDTRDETLSDLRRLVPLSVRL